MKAKAPPIGGAFFVLLKVFLIIEILKTTLCYQSALERFNYPQSGLFVEPLI